jgi:hypothetical protein
MDAIAFCLPIGESIARIGCYVYGCCWGKETNGKLGIIYSSVHARVIRDNPHLLGKKLYPVQLIGMAAHLAQFIMFVALLPLLQHHGMMTIMYLITHPIIRVVLEQFRQDNRGKLFGPFTHTNLYSAIQFAAGLVLLGIISISGTTVTLTLTSPLVLMFEQPQILAYLILIFALAAVAFGVHINSVGSWVSGIPSKANPSEKLAKVSDTTSSNRSN